MRTLKLGLIGLGQGAAAVLPTMASMSTIEVVAGADRVRSCARASSSGSPSRKCTTTPPFCAPTPKVDAVWIATPNRFHCAQAVMNPMSDVGKPLVILVDGDVGRLVGAVLCDEAGWLGDVVSLDSVALQELDFVDVGELMLPSGAVPLVLRSRIFS